MATIVPPPIERYLASLNHGSSPVLDAIAAAGAERDLPLIDAEVGALLRVLATAVGATKILEVGSAIGYSGIWLAGALPPGGMLITLEMNEARAREARENFARAGVADRTTIVVGDAKLKIAKVAGPFDLIFLDTDKQLYLTLLDRLVSLLRPGGVLVTDNVLWSGEVVPGYVPHPTRPPEDTQALIAFNERVARHPDLLTTVVPLRDGVSISVKKR
jgi:predicted O-methyltransferase YrrM